MSMSLQSFFAEGRLRHHHTSPREVAELLQVVDRDLADASFPQISADRRYVTTYNAALALATLVLHASGYRAVGLGHHWTTIRLLPEIMGPQAQARADYLDNCRNRRNTADYDRAGVILEIEARELLSEVAAFRADVLEWLQATHPSLLAE
jgi:hypothetical protein